jgi:hypothetical protein
MSTEKTVIKKVGFEFKLKVWLELRKSEGKKAYQVKGTTKGQLTLNMYYAAGTILSILHA